jgi:CRP/FNR family transcriptional regulator, anaerobic regulatory protein
MSALTFDRFGQSMAAESTDARIACKACPLSDCRGLRPLSADQIDFMQNFKQGEMIVDRGTQILVQGSISPHLYTVLEGVLLRYKTIEDGRRQIVNYLFPGDFLGLQGAMQEPLTHGIEALSKSKVCVFARDRIIELFSQQPQLGFDLSWLVATEESALEEHLMAVGRRTAGERIAYLALFLFTRARDTEMVKGNKVKITMTQEMIADTLGLSIVHTNRTLQALRKFGIVSWTTDELIIPDLDKAVEYSKYEYVESNRRTFV